MFLGKPVGAVQSSAAQSQVGGIKINFFFIKRVFFFFTFLIFFRDLLHIAGMGSALGVGFQPEPRQQEPQQPVDHGFIWD